MNDKILVTYASRAGSTAEIAQAIGKTLTDRGAWVDVLSMQAVKNLSRYRAVVVGSAIRGSKWLPEALQFIQEHHAELAQKPCAMFTVPITLAMSSRDQYRQAVAKWVQPVRAQVKPVCEGFFPGRLDFSKLPLNWETLMLRLVVTLGIFPRGDQRDWNAISTWAESLPPLLLK
jgi:menaquinone-dependent protoporphyrinogen oxidase